MMNILDKAKIALADLPEKDQAELVDDLVKSAHERKLKSMIDEGHTAIDAGDARTFDIEAFLKASHLRHGNA